MNRGAIKAALDDWESQLMAATVNVMELQNHDTHKILDEVRAELKGQTRDLVKPAFDKAKCLWEGFDLIQRQLDKAAAKYNEIKDAWFPSRTTLDEIEALLIGETVDLPAVLVPLDERELTSGKKKAATTSLAKLLKQLVEAFAEKRNVVLRVAKALKDLNNRLGAHDELIKEVRLQAEFLGGATLLEFRKCEDAAKTYRADVYKDPIGIDEALVQRNAYLENVKLRYTAAKTGKPLPPEPSPHTPVRPTPQPKPVDRTPVPVPVPTPTPPQTPVPTQPARDPQLDALINGPGGDTPAPPTDTPVDPALTDLISKPGKPAEQEVESRPDPRIEHVLTTPTPKPSSDLEAVLNGNDLPKPKKDDKGEAKPAPTPPSDRPDPALDKVVNKPAKPATDPLADLVDGEHGHQASTPPAVTPEPKSARDAEAERLAEVLEGKGKPDSKSTPAAPNPKATKPQDGKQGGSVADLIEGKPKSKSTDAKDGTTTKPLEDLF